MNNFLRDLFGVQFIKVEGESLPQSATLNFEGVLGDFDQETQEVTISLAPATYSASFTVANTPSVTVVTATAEIAGLEGYEGSLLPLWPGEAPDPSLGLCGAWMSSSEEGEVTVQFVGTYEGGSVSVRLLKVP